MSFLGIKQKRKVFILVGHPDNDSLNWTLADEYEKGAKEAGNEVRRMTLEEMNFDVVLRHGYRTIQALEPDLKMFQENVLWCDHFVVFYPTWWSAMPAKLKGLFDRTWIPGFAFHMHKNGLGWDGLMKGKSASMIVTMDSNALLQRILFGDTTNELKRGMLGFAGFSPVRVHKFGGIKNADTNKRFKIKEKVFQLGKEVK
jgi:NAD(P)H dehydrogenase (quinone)